MDAGLRPGDAPQADGKMVGPEGFEPPTKPL